MSAQTRLKAMRAAMTALDAAQAQPVLVKELVRHGLAEQFRIASEELHREAHKETMCLVEVSAILAETGLAACDLDARGPWRD